MRLAKLVLAVLLMLGLASAAPPDFSLVWPITAVIVAIFLALMNMLGNAISSPQIGAWVKSEYRELIAGIILSAIIVAFFVTSTGVASALTGTGNYVEGSAKIVENILSNSSTGYDRAMHDIIKAGTRIRAAATYAPYMSIPAYFIGFTYSTSPLSGAGILFSPLAGATQGIANNIFLYEAILLLIKFAYTAVPKVLLPISLALRIIPFTRKIGNTLIAVCIGAMIFLPLSVYIIAEMHKAIAYPQASLSSSELNKLDPDAAAMTVAEPFCKMVPIRFILGLNDLILSMLVAAPLLLTPWTAPFFPPVQQLVQNVIYPLVMTTLQLVYDATLLGWTIAGEGGDYGKKAFDVIYPFLAKVNNLVLLGYLDAVLIGIITISGARSVSVALGGEWYLAGIQRLI